MALYHSRMPVHFDEFEFGPVTGELWRGGTLVPLQPHAKVLALLIGQPG
jgi:hypothetical protein